MFSLRLKSLSTVSLIALTLAGMSHAALAGGPDGVVDLNTGAAIDFAATDAPLMPGTNPQLTGDGTGTGTFTAT